MTTPDVYMRLLSSVQRHLAVCPLATEIASIQVRTDPFDGEQGVVHLDRRQLADLAADLLDWADTLTEITATAWRPPHGETVHLTVTGRIADGTRLEVYGGTSYAEDVFGADLQPGGRQSVALSVLRAWASSEGRAA
jgi:hypothetical protein